MIKRTFLFLVGCLSLFSANAQQDFQFKKGLVAFTPVRYGREAVYADRLAYQLYTGTLKTPADGAVLGTDEKGAFLTWQALEADSANRLYRRGAGRGFGGFGRGGYTYLTYTADAGKTALLNITGNSSVYVNGVLHAGDPYASGWLYIPVKLKKGLNEFYVRGTMITAKLLFPQKPVLLNAEDATLPSIVVGSGQNRLQGAVVVINTSAQDLRGLQIRSRLNGKEVTGFLPSVPSLSTRKVPFAFEAGAIAATGKVRCELSLLQNNKVIDTASVLLDAVEPTTHYAATFTSNIDGSLQYYGVTPQVGGAKQDAALFFSVHGAGVEAIGQARAYGPKTWGTLVAPTNRRPRGFNWEDWGRLDALEVLNIAKETFRPHPQQVYLTGHSMGGHGTWFLGATYPDKWAAIAPCAGYPTLKGYGSADGLIPDSSSNPLEQMLLRSGNQSDVIRLASNYKPLGVYIFHGDDDRTVSVNYARQMRGILGGFHADMSYYEYPGGSHWFGNESVDWKPLFDFFQWHTRPVDSAVNTIDFMTASPGISDAFRWASVQQQEHSLGYSRLQLQRNRAGRTINGATQNVRLLKLDLSGFGAGTPVSIRLDGGDSIAYTTTGATDAVFLRKQNGKWAMGEKPSAGQKNPQRYGTFKDAFNHRMVFVYSTGGTPEENAWSLDKARYDAETWYYRGNGAVDLVADKDFVPANFTDRGVIVYGNKSTNKAWKSLLSDCPIQVERGKVTAGGQVWQGDDLAAYFVWPNKTSAVASVGVVSGSGIRGMQAASANQYFAGASGFPDFMVFRLSMLAEGVSGVKMAGFYDQDWKLANAEMVQVQ